MLIKHFPPIYFVQLKAAHIQLSERSNELTRELANTIEGRRVSELNHATVLQQLKAQLDVCSGAWELVLCEGEGKFNTA